MSSSVQHFHEEEPIGRTSDYQVARRLLKYLKPCRRPVILAVALTFGLNLLRILQPVLTRYAIDWYILPRNIGGLKWIALAYLAVLLTTFVFSYVQGVLIEHVGRTVMYDLRGELFAKLQRQEVAYYDRTPVGRLMTRLTSDVDALHELFTSGVIDVLGDVVMIFAIVGMMTWLDWHLTLIALTTVPLLFAATTWFRRRSRKGYDRVRTRLARINAFLHEHLTGAQTVQLLNAQAQSLKKFRKINDDHRQAHDEVITYHAIFYPLVDFISTLGLALIILYGGSYALRSPLAVSHFSVGALVAFVQYYQQLFQPIRDLSDKYNVLQSAVVSSHRIFETLDLPVSIGMPALPKKVERVEGRVEFQNVWFAYQHEHWVLKDVSFIVEPGQSVAFVGHTGAGKTTLINLLTRLYDVQKGRILLDGVDVRDWDLQELRRHFAVVLQDVFLFSGTVESNIRLGQADISEEQVVQAAKSIHADHFIRRLCGGYQTELKERGAGLSVGQKQLISFARAMAFKPTLLLLDEATSSIDVQTERLIQEAIDYIMRNRTSLIIAHRLSTVQKADHIVVLHHGEVREQGTHQQLLNERGLYWKLYRLQFADRSHAEAPA
jgi:ATP-binding cassette subfamily B protein